VTRRLVLIVLIDALGWELGGDQAFMPELDAPRAPIRSVLGYSSANLPTIMTGRLPWEHGHLSMYRRAARNGVFAGVKPALALASRMTDRRWRISGWLARWLRRRGVTGYFSLYEIPLSVLAEFDLSQRRDILAPGAFDGMPGLADFALGTGAGRIWNWSVPEDRAFAELSEEIDRGEKRVLFLYTAALDGLMHAVGPQSEEVGDALAGYARRIEGLRERARQRYEEVRVFVFGDHGMAPVCGVHDLRSELELAGFGLGGPVLYFLDSTMARFWFRSAADRRRVEEILARHTWGRILRDEELESLGALLPDRRHGELIFLLEEGEIIVPSFLSGRPVRGMHGYHPDARHSFTVLLTDAADRPYPANLIELHALLRDEIREATA
jgi:hypothetical protein